MKPSQVAAVLPKLSTSGRAPFIWGDPGIGKSDIIRSVAAAMKLDLIDMRLALYDPTDLRGFPVVKGTGKSQAMHFVPPAILPTKGKGILFLDELPSAPPSVQAAAYQLILDKRLGEYELPAGWSIVAAGNHARNGGVHYSLPPALANRFVHIEMGCDAGDWDLWAAANGITDITRAFIRFRPELLHTYDGKRDSRAYGCPRTWAFASDIISGAKRLPAAEELHDVIDVRQGPDGTYTADLNGEAPAQPTAKPAAPARPALDFCPDERFTEKLPEWRAIVE